MIGRYRFQIGEWAPQLRVGHEVTWSGERFDSLGGGYLYDAYGYLDYH
jgi:hypothetical protein